MKVEEVPGPAAALDVAQPSTAAPGVARGADWAGLQMAGAL